MKVLSANGYGECIAAFRHVWKFYGSVTALRDVNVCIPKGFTLIVGPNGSGKSTLLALLVGASRPSRGIVRLAGLDPWSNPLVGRIVSAVLDRTRLPPWLRGVDFARLVARSWGVSWSRVVEYAEALGVNSYWHLRIGGYSSGMYRKFLVLASLISSAPIVVVDEPFSGLDDRSIYRVVEALVRVRREDRSIIVATHVVPEQLIYEADYAVKIVGGEVVGQGRPVEVLKGSRMLIL